MTSLSGAAAAAPPLRFGIMCSGTSFAAWQARCIENLLELPGVEAALLIVDDNPSPQRPLAEKLRQRFASPTTLWRIYQRAFLKSGSPATWPVDLGPKLSHVPVLRCVTKQVGKYTQRFFPKDLEAIGSHDLDFILRFGFNIIRGEILTVPRYGVWSFHHGDPERYRGAPPALWEIHNREHVTGAVLQRLTDGLDAGIILQRGYFKTNASSYVRSRDQLFFGGADWPAKVCVDIRNGRADYVDAPPLATKAPIYRDPANRQLLRFLSNQARSRITDQFASLFRHQQWGVGVIDAPVHEVVGLSGGKALSHPVRWLSEPSGRFLADPFAIEHVADGGTKLTIVAEDFDWSSNIGRISAVESTNSGTFGDPRLLMNFPFHMSYPFLFRHDERWYCVPETNEAREVCLYAFDPATLAWEKEATLLRNRRIVDSTLVHHDGVWWLFGTDEEQGANLKLHLWYADDLKGPWQPHPANPVKTDIRSSRPAGRPFVHEGRFYRPSQDCSRSYGGAVTLNLIRKLTPTEFEEEPVSSLGPAPGGPYPDGLHTVCGIGGRTVIDARRDVFIRQAFNAALSRKGAGLLRRLGKKPPVGTR
ncbi:MAG: hypothetical protein AVDCRST_MAG91-1730 [uncultured Sphingomonadaceae bacterium]|uniref:Glucosamine inositolphosphorylceramide transferase 1 N-terminal domain-containing protein n=1 Tax=uncultured Sphingomonadaceae bacterium TaxID=169976 RepID=A0A6J4T474_9SPHN|nr:MAG: hypothetical protein AVDCRST_MAG91-1730 [uncultured Sphingomonadaceae bacterium]